MKKIIMGAAAAAMLGGMLLAPSAFAADHAAEGNCDEIAGTEALDGVVGLYGELPGGGQGCLVAEGEGQVQVNPVDDGHIGVHEGPDGSPALYGDCAPREEGAGFTPWDPTAGGTDASKCAPG